MTHQDERDLIIREGKKSALINLLFGIFFLISFPSMIHCISLWVKYSVENACSVFLTLLFLLIISISFTLIKYKE